MAFVFRAKRDIKLSNLEENNHFSGEYYQEPQLVKNIEKQSSEFQSKSQRNLNINKFNTPGPGSYEKNIQDQDLFGGFNQYRKPKNIIETIKMSVIPTDIQKFIQKYQSIAFNSRGKRFNYKNEELEKEKPGPGAYEPDINYSSSPKNNNKENSLNKNNNNINNINDSRSVISNDNNISLNLNIMPKNSSRNNSSFISSNNNKSTESTSLNNNSTNISYFKFKIKNKSKKLFLRKIKINTSSYSHYRNSNNNNNSSNINNTSQNKNEKSNDKVYKCNLTKLLTSKDGKKNFLNNNIINLKNINSFGYIKQNNKMVNKFPFYYKNNKLIKEKRTITSRNSFSNNYHNLNRSNNSKYKKSLSKSKNNTNNKFNKKLSGNLKNTVLTQFHLKHNKTKKNLISSFIVSRNNSLLKNKKKTFTGRSSKKLNDSLSIKPYKKELNKINFNFNFNINFNIDINKNRQKKYLLAYKYKNNFGYFTQRNPIINNSKLNKSKNKIRRDSFQRKNNVNHIFMNKK
jgi:hypothetical protein